MAENLIKKPAKGILKTSTSFEKTEIQKPSRFKETKWDEMNIIATLHPADKDYGHMKIEEPKTPYNWAENQSDEADGIDATMLAEKIQLSASQPPKVLTEEAEESEEEEDTENPENKEKRKSFESKRKLHYNEFQAVKLARKLMEEDEEEDTGERAEADEEEEHEDEEESQPSPSQPTEDLV